MQLYPTNTKTIVTLARLIRPDTARTLSERLSGRMIPAAAHLAAGGFLGWQLAMRRDGAAQITLFGSADTDEADLRWMAEQTAIVGERADLIGELIHDYKFHSLRALAHPLAEVLL